MPTTTAAGLLAALLPNGPAVENGALAFDADPPADLDAAIRLLHTGVRALLTGRRWYGCDTNTGRVTALNPAAPIPAGVSLLAVEGDERWDRLLDAVGPSGPRSAGTPHREPSSC